MILTKVKNEVGATAIEYGLIASLVAVVAVSGMSAVGMNLKNTYCTISTHLGGAGTCSGSALNGTGSGGSTSETGSGGSTSETGGTTGSADLDSQTGPAYLSALEKTFKDFDPNYLDASLGGKGVVNTNDTFIQIENHMGDAMTAFNADPKNKDNQITNVYGLYTTDKQPITSLGGALGALHGGGYLKGKNNGDLNNNSIEFTTQKGEVYILNNSDNKPHKI